MRCGTIEFDTQFGEADEPIEIVLVDVPDEFGIGQDMMLDLAGNGCLQGELDGVARQIVGARMPSPPQQELGIVQLAARQ